MKIPLTLNGEKTVLEANPEDSLMKTLHKNGCTSVKSGCRGGFCGTCTVLFDDKPISACKMPVGLAKGAKITTLESFTETAEYKIIMEGFSKVGIKLCGYCNSGKIFSAYQIMKTNKNITKDDILEQIKHLSPCCTDLDTLANGILYATRLKNKGIKRVTSNE